MKVEIICEKCKCKFIDYRSSKRIPARFCSIKCRGKIGGQRNIVSYEEKLQHLIKSFEKNVIKKEGCWSWSGQLNKQGYPLMSCSYKMGTLFGHRASFMIYKGKITKGLHICHSCDNPICTNPDHLWVGTAKDNNDDMTLKGRRKFTKPPIHLGSKNPASKLDEDKVKEIKKMLNSGLKCQYIADIYKVSYKIVNRIKHNHTWRHVT